MRQEVAKTADDFGSRESHDLVQFLCQFTPIDKFGLTRAKLIGLL
jgi:hypothetical protein